MHPGGSAALIDEGATLSEAAFLSTRAEGCCPRENLSGRLRSARCRARAPAAGPCRGDRQVPGRARRDVPHGRAGEPTPRS